MNGTAMMQHPAFAAPLQRQPQMMRPPTVGPVQPGPQFHGPPVQQGGGGPVFLGPPIHQGGGYPVPQQQGYDGLRFLGPPLQRPPMPLEHALALLGQKHPDLPWKQRRQMARSQQSPVGDGNPLAGLIAALSAAMQGGGLAVG